MAFAAICTYPDFYKACVASSGNHDNYIYTRQWGENYQGITDDIASFHVDTNMDIAHRLKGHLLLVTGESDKNVNPAHTYRLAAKLMEYDLIEDVGRLDAPGKPLLYGTTEQFLRSFGVKSIGDLPVISPELEADFRIQAGQEIYGDEKVNQLIKLIQIQINNDHVQKDTMYLVHMNG